MLENPQPLSPPTARVSQPTTPPVETPAGEAILAPPTAEQVRTADDVFAAPAQRDPAVTLLGVLTSAMLLRDVAVDTFSKSAEEKRREQEGRGDRKPESDA